MERCVSFGEEISSINGKKATPLTVEGAAEQGVAAAGAPRT
jgi:hypothetical protein